jgi:hypothetical protein
VPPSSAASFDSIAGKWSLPFVSTDSLHNSWQGGYDEFVFSLVKTDTSTAVVERQQVKGGLRIFPNPGTGQVNVAFDSPRSDMAHIRFYDVKGTAVFDKKYAVKKGENRILVNMAGINGGVYSVRARVGEWEAGGVFLKE